MAYTHQAKATEQFGIKFRSQLEAEWAHFFHDIGAMWEYVDDSWHDFLVDGVPVEIKPLDSDAHFDGNFGGLTFPFHDNHVPCVDCFLHEAIVRTPLNERLFVFQGRPKAERKKSLAWYVVAPSYIQPIGMAEPLVDEQRSLSDSLNVLEDIRKFNEEMWDKHERRKSLSHLFFLHTSILRMAVDIGSASIDCIKFNSPPPTPEDLEWRRKLIEQLKELEEQDNQNPDKPKPR